VGDTKRKREIIELEDDDHDDEVKEIIGRLGEGDKGVSLNVYVCVWVCK